MGTNDRASAFGGWFPGLEPAVGFPGVSLVDIKSSFCFFFLSFANSARPRAEARRRRKMERKKTKDLMSGLKAGEVTLAQLARAFNQMVFGWRRLSFPGQPSKRKSERKKTKLVPKIGSKSLFSQTSLSFPFSFGWRGNRRLKARPGEAAVSPEATRNQI